MKFFFTIYFILCICITNIFGQKQGTLDSSFGTNGKVLTSSSTLSFVCNGGVKTFDNKIVTVGSASGGSFAVRYLTDGTLDSSFGKDGVTFITGAGIIQGVAIQADNKILICGYDYDLFGPYFITLSRLNLDGTFDSGFGINGIVRSYAAQNSNGIAIQPDGKILVVGNYTDLTAILRFTTNGTLDASFGNNGIVQTSFGGGSVIGTCIKQQSDGKIIIGGGTDEELLLGRYTDDGVPDQSFGTNGKVLLDIGKGPDAIQAIGLQDNGNILAAGYTSTASGQLFDTIKSILLDFNADGSLNQTFGTKGYVLDAGILNTIFNAVSIGKDGKIVCGGKHFRQS